MPLFVFSDGLCRCVGCVALQRTRFMHNGAFYGKSLFSDVLMFCLGRVRRFGRHTLPVCRCPFFRRPLSLCRVCCSATHAFYA
ncbi:hypothetical protein [Kingella potus]|uniref:hypothetical protein n=1 Tax=Kingella potus TaxID=265175 RepID=UPI001FD0C027|nr:hypothetical protein [Kingella potus]UOP01456.1 hypothetical protein LVJ84_04420 [Kingella potus]